MRLIDVSDVSYTQIAPLTKTYLGVINKARRTVLDVVELTR